MAEIGGCGAFISGSRRRKSPSARRDRRSPLRLHQTGFREVACTAQSHPIDQTDLALRRRFNLTERVKLDIRAEYFNVFNHPMFGAPGLNQPDTQFGISDFGKVDTTTNEVLGGGGTEGGQNAL